MLRNFIIRMFTFILNPGFIMKLEISPYNQADLPPVQLPDTEFLRLLGEKGIRQLISDHYDLVRKSSINNLFPKDNDEFEKAKLNSSDFIIQILGGHPYFNENRGKPMLVQRHSPFKITPEARIVWLQCYREVLVKLNLPEELIRNYWNYLDALSMRMVNVPGQKHVFDFNMPKKG